MKKAHPKASILKGSRAVFNIKGNDYRLIASVQYAHGVLMAVLRLRWQPSSTASRGAVCGRRPGPVGFHVHDRGREDHGDRLRH